VHDYDGLGVLIHLVTSPNNDKLKVSTESIPVLSLCPSQP
jgi:hypothetical protein